MKRFIGPLSIIVPYVLLSGLVQSGGDIALAFPWIAAIGAAISLYASSQKAKGGANAGAASPKAGPGAGGRARVTPRAVKIKQNGALQELASLFSRLPNPGKQKTKTAPPISSVGDGGIDAIETLIKSLSSDGGGIGNAGGLGGISNIFRGN